MKNKRSYKAWWHIALLIVLPAIIYVQSVKFDYTNFDDNGIIQQKFNIVKNIRAIDTAFKTDAFFNPTGDFYRPVQNISFMLDAQVSHDKLWMFHITNLLIHILTCIALYYFLMFLDLRRDTAFFLALLFGVHPLFASGVGWVPSRGDILIGLQGLLLFMTFGNYFKTGKIIYLILHVILFLITIFTKETTILFPLFFLYYYFFIIKLKFSFKKLSPFIILWTAIMVFFFILRKKVVANTGATADVLGIMPFFKNNTVIPTIIGKFFVPFHLSTFPLYDNVTTIIGLIFLLVIVYLTFEYSIEKKWAALMGLLWFLLFAIPPTIYRLENADIFFNYLEHRTYLPMIGIIIILGFFLDAHLSSAQFKKYFMWAYVPVILILGTLAYIHCSDYQNHVTLTERAAELDNPSALAGSANDWLSKGDTTKALEYINKALVLNNKDAGIYFQRGKIMARMQKHEEADQDMSMALSLMPRYFDALLARSVERRIMKKYEAAFRDIFSASQIDSANPKVYFSFGNLFLATQNYNDAVTAFTKAVTLQPAYGEAYNNLAYAKILSGNDTGAIYDCHRALALMKDKPNPIVYNNFGRAFTHLDEFDSAFYYFDKAITLDKNFADGYFQRGLAEQKNNNMDGACNDWRNAERLGYKDTSGVVNKYCALSYSK